MSAVPVNIEEIHPDIWRASQLARSRGLTVETGYPNLSAELPGNGWPVGTLIELLVQQSGVGELRLLRPALEAVSKRPIGLVQPPLAPNIASFAYLGIPVDKLILMRPTKTADALWCVEQILRTGTFGAVIFWQQHIRGESLRRLLLASQSAETLFFLIRPLVTAQDASPATLRLTVRPAANAAAVTVLKRKGPSSNKPLLVDVSPSPILMSPYGKSRKAGTLEPAIASERNFLPV
jgi:cell division inhibitor SulA/protein ImuA